MVEPQLAYLCFSTAAPETDAIQRALTAGPAPLIQGPFVDTRAGLVGATEAARLVIVRMSFSYPSPLLADPAQYAAWPDWKAGSGRWQSHLIVAATPLRSDAPEAPRVTTATLFAVSAAIARATGADAVAWSGNLLFHDSALFSRAVAYSSLPPDVVVRCHWRGRPPSGLGARTEGLRALGLPELDYPPTGEDAGTIDTKLKNVAAYLIAKGMVLNDGDTFSIGNDAPVNVKHTKDESGNMVLMLKKCAIS